MSISRGRRIPRRSIPFFSNTKSVLARSSAHSQRGEGQALPWIADRKGIRGQPFNDWFTAVRRRPARQELHRVRGHAFGELSRGGASRQSSSVAPNANKNPSTSDFANLGSGPVSEGRFCHIRHARRSSI
jgi:hypothetical protein